MAYVPVPKDLTKIRSKVLFGLTLRQLVCFGSGGLIGIPLFLLLRKIIGVNIASLVMIAVMMPFFLLAMYEKNGQPLEKILRNYMNVHVFRAKVRPYRTDNYYAALERQYKLNQEVQHIVNRTRKTPSKTLPCGTPPAHRRKK